MMHLEALAEYYEEEGFSSMALNSQPKLFTSLALA
jgi:hypothetical protein